MTEQRRQELNSKNKPYGILMIIVCLIINTLSSQAKIQTLTVEEVTITSKSLTAFFRDVIFPIIESESFDYDKYNDQIFLEVKGDSINATALVTLYEDFGVLLNENETDVDIHFKKVCKLDGYDIFFTGVTVEGIIKPLNRFCKVRKDVHTELVRLLCINDAYTDWELTMEYGKIVSCHIPSVCMFRDKLYRSLLPADERIAKLYIPVNIKIKQPDYTIANKIVPPRLNDSKAKRGKPNRH